MGIKGLWPLLASAKETRNLTELAFTEGFQRNNRQQRALVLAVDGPGMLDSLKAGSHNGVHSTSPLESFFGLLCKFNKAAVNLLFVFEGPNRPDEKRGKKVRSTVPRLYREAQELVDAFGYVSKEAEGEADYLLAFLSREGHVDGVISEDSDLLALGANNILRKTRGSPSSELKYDIYSLDSVTESAGLDRDGIILVGLLSGNDTQRGLSDCGIGTAIQLGRSGLGKDLMDGFRLYSADPILQNGFVESWRAELRDELTHNRRGYLERRRPSAAARVDTDFPDSAALEDYAYPPSGIDPVGLQVLIKNLKTPRQPDIARIVSFCKERFRWSNDEIIHRLSPNFFKAVVYRLLQSPLVVFDRRQLTFRERYWKTELKRESPTTSLKNGVESVHATFTVKDIMAISSLPVSWPETVTLWVPLGVLSIAKLPRGLPQEQFDLAALGMVDDADDDIEIVYVRKRAKNGEYFLQVD
ncbi:hypothetical protein V5O48_007251 [Marasmius crinis-equi]|uniref:XPG-I domain-containing protein n=1 Tax=Marasmius crinis-equi TaxID=585013 RepID=A0ABR3FHT4_9AGAR